MTASDQRGEQTINRDAKTLGGIKGFSSNKMNVLKWCLNRPKQAEVMKELFEFAGIRGQPSQYKPLRELQIKRSEKLVSELIEVLEEKFLNPFGVYVEQDRDCVYNLSSGQQYQGSADDLIGIREMGQKLYDDFKKDRLFSTTVKFHEKIKRQNPTLFSDSSKPKPRKHNNYEVVEANRNILGKLVTLSANARQPIDFQKALSFPLYHVPLSLAYPDCTKRSTQKSTLLEIILADRIESTVIHQQRQVSTLIIDMIAHYRVISTNLPQTFEEWIMRFLQTIQNGYKQIDIVADTYRDFSIKSGERLKRGSTSKLLIKSVQCKIPRDINKFFSNNDNKSRLIDLTFEYIKQHPIKCLTILKCDAIVLSGDTFSEIVNHHECRLYQELRSDQEEADTKVVLHALEVLSKTDDNVCIRSPSGDTDIFVVALGTIIHRSRVKFDYGNGSNRKEVWLDQISLKVDQRQALIGFHAFTGNDYVSAFFRKGKGLCWKTMTKNDLFVEMFTQLGDDWELSQQMKATLERYVCRLYGSKKDTVNAVRYDMFEKKQRKGIMVDLSNLPPSQSALFLHMERANYVARLWKLARIPMINPPSPIGWGWDEDGDIQWVESILPDEVSSILLQTDDADSENDNSVSDGEEYGDEEIESDDDDYDDEYFED